eukprot:TRINITY_DN4184_c0_g1_i1.p1 TRINITY_DN4184_c0_g1~~TRINITY_DN4184_c0_g1_i1.p1  ORF type:complete len:361 (-),score=71.50 TRINITY_DN4184_c0_g1_i1:40-1122(-)
MKNYTQIMMIATLLILVTYLSSCDASIDCKNVTGFAHNRTDFSYWNNVLKKHVSAGEKHGIKLNTVDYAAVVNDTDFQHFGCQLENTDLKDFTYNEWYAFYINAYNYLAIYSILEHPCAIDAFGECTTLTSIREIFVQQPALPFTTPAIWDKPLKKIAGETVSLNDIEHQRLRDPTKGGFSEEDPRLHACIVCASVSCPNLRATAYTAENLEAEMIDNTKNFLENQDKGSASERNSIRVSPIFFWFFGDFNNATRSAATDGKVTSKSKDLASFLELYAPKEVANFVKAHADDINSKKSISTFSYDWSLNGKGTLQELCKINRVCVPTWSFIVAGVGLVVVVAIVIVVVKTKKGKSYQEIH